MQQGGKPVKFYAIAATATPVAVTITDAQGQTVTLGANERLHISSVTLSTTNTTAGVSTTLFDDADDDSAADTGEQLAAALLTLSGGVASFVFPHEDGQACGLGRVPKLLQPTGIGVVNGMGFIRNT